MFDPSVLAWWGWVIVGGIVWFVIQNFVLPDPWAEWLAQRRNGPVALLPFGLIALTIWLLNVVGVLGGAFLEVLSRTRLEWWVWGLLIVGIIIVGLYVLVGQVERLKLPKGGKKS